MDRNQSRGIQLIHAKRLTHHPNTRYTLLVMDSWLNLIYINCTMFCAYSVMSTSWTFSLFPREFQIPGNYYTLFFIRTSKFWPRLIVLEFLHNLSLNCSFIMYMHFDTVIKHVRHSFDFLLCSLSVSNRRKTCDETPHVMM